MSEEIKKCYESEEPVKHYNCFECLRVLGAALANTDNPETRPQIPPEDWANCFEQMRVLQEGLSDARRFYK